MLFPYMAGGAQNVVHEGRRIGKDKMVYALQYVAYISSGRAPNRPISVVYMPGSVLLRRNELAGYLKLFGHFFKFFRIVTHKVGMINYFQELLNYFLAFFLFHY